MRSLRSLASQSPAVAISAIALLFSLGAGAGYAASTINGHRIEVNSLPGNRIIAHSVGDRELATPAFHKLNLVNGWSAVAGSQPGFVKRGGVVELNGAIAQNPTGATTFANLPLADRPGHLLFITIYTSGGAVGALEITPSGIMAALGSNAPAYTSIDGVSFVVGR
jgi:hypothetical protein